MFHGFEGICIVLRVFGENGNNIHSILRGTFQTTVVGQYQQQRKIIFPRRSRAPGNPLDQATETNTTPQKRFKLRYFVISGIPNKIDLSE